jgi:integrase
MAIVSLSDRLIKQLPLPETGYAVHFDEGTKGLGVRITAAGARSFILQYRTKAGVQHKTTIGGCDDWTVEKARKFASKLKVKIDEGGDPVGERRALQSAPTVADLCERFLADYAPRKSPRTAAEYKRQLRQNVLEVDAEKHPALAKLKFSRMKVHAVSTDDAELFIRAIRDRGAVVQSNRIAALLSKMFNLAIKWKWSKEPNPFRGLERVKEHPRQRYLKPAELQQLLQVINEYPYQQARDAMRLLLLTGCRVGELLTAKWEHIDLEARTWSKPPQLVKQRRIHVIPLSQAAVEILQSIKRTDSPFVFPASGTRDSKQGCRVTLRQAWSVIRERAGLQDFRLHDLRHCHAQILASSGFSLHIVGQALGHTVASTTMRYAHVSQDPLRQASEHVAAVLAGKSAEVLQLKRR